MRVVVHDYSGHPFQLQLSRELARRGHTVVHQYSADYVTGKGDLAVAPSDSPTFTVEPLSLGHPFPKYSPARRLRDEVRYGQMLARRIRNHRPDVLLMCNVPLMAHTVAETQLRRTNLPTVFWHQDVYSHAIATAAASRLGAPGRMVGKLADRAEARIARQAAHVVAISSTFLPVLQGWRVPEQQVTVMENWGALDELPMQPRDNKWAQAHGLVSGPTLLYSGTLGLKHDPEVLFRLARAVEAYDSRGRVVVVSEGRGREYLERRLVSEPCKGLLLLDFQPYECLPEVMASADILLALLESDASAYSVPSKVLSYLCAGRAILGIMPTGNGAAQTIRASGAGVVVPAGNIVEAQRAVVALLEDDEGRARMGEAARRYAERTFDIAKISDRFEAVLTEAALR